MFQKQKKGQFGEDIFVTFKQSSRPNLSQYWEIIFDIDNYMNSINDSLRNITDDITEKKLNNKKKPINTQKIKQHEHNKNNNTKTIKKGSCSNFVKLVFLMGIILFTAAFIFRQYLVENFNITTLYEKLDLK